MMELFKKKKTYKVRIVCDYCVVAGQHEFSWIDVMKGESIIGKLATCDSCGQSSAVVQGTSKGKRTYFYINPTKEE